jgi:hypothetical protein
VGPLLSPSTSRHNASHLTTAALLCPSPSLQPLGLGAGLQAAAYRIQENDGSERQTVIMTYATTPMFSHDKAHLFLWSLANTQLPDGSNMSSHTVIMCLSEEAAQRCARIHLGQACVLQSHMGELLKPKGRRSLSEEDAPMQHFSSSWYGLGVYKSMFVLSTLLLNTDVFFLDMDVITFQVRPSNPQPSFSTYYAHEIV